MGSSLCCMKNSSPLEQIPQYEEVIEGTPPRVDDEGKITIKRNVTLKECLLASPSLNPQHLVNGNEVQVFAQLPQKVYPSSSRNLRHVLNSPQTPEWKKLSSPQVRRTLSSPETPQWREPSILNPHFLPSPDVRMEFFTPRLSFSSEIVGKLGKVDEKDDQEEASFTPIMRTSGGGRMKKNVSFRGPEVADIYIFYSQKDNFEEESAF